MKLCDLRAIFADSMLFFAKNHFPTHELFCTEEIMSYASNGESGAKYLYDLLTSYDMIPKMAGIVVRLVTGTKHEVLTEDENLL